MDSGSEHKDALPSSVPDSPLFKLPAELRVMIYRYAIISNRRVKITKSRGIPEPPLLSVSEVLRAETFGTFYRENKFKSIVHDSDPSPLVLAYRKFSASFQFPSTRLRHRMVSVIEITGTRNWKNLVGWFRLTHQKLCCGFGVPPDGNPELSLLTGLFEMIVRGPSMTPEALDFLLESMRPTFVNLDADWGND